MSEHYTKSTVSATAWCKKCNLHTAHAVHDRRLGACLVCLERLGEEAENRKLKPKPPEQGKLFK